MFSNRYIFIENTANKLEIPLIKPTHVNGSTYTGTVKVFGTQIEKSYPHNREKWGDISDIDQTIITEYAKQTAMTVLRENASKMIYIPPYLIDTKFLLNCALHRCLILHFVPRPMDVREVIYILQAFPSTLLVAGPNYQNDLALNLALMCSVDFKFNFAFMVRNSDIVKHFIRLIRKNVDLALALRILHKNYKMYFDVSNITYDHPTRTYTIKDTLLDSYAYENEHEGKPNTFKYDSIVVEYSKDYYNPLVSKTLEYEWNLLFDNETRVQYHPMIGLAAFEGAVLRNETFDLLDKYEKTRGTHATRAIDDAVKFKHLYKPGSWPMFGKVGRFTNTHFLFV